MIASGGDAGGARRRWRNLLRLWVGPVRLNIQVQIRIRIWIQKPQAAPALLNILA